MIKADAVHKIVNTKKVTSDDCPSFSGIVTSECKGELWVDNIEKPNIALANSYAVGGFAFLGDIDSTEEFNLVKKFINEQLFPLLKSRGIEYFEFSINRETLIERILQMFSDKVLQRETEFHYRRDEQISQIHRLPEQYAIYEVNEQLWNWINEGKIKNSALITKRILGSWESISDFFDKSLSFCITYRDEVVAVIVGTARFNNTIAIDIATEEAHQKNGLGTMLTQTFVNECIRRGLTPQWDCMESNQASKKLVEKAGFKLLKQNDVYWIHI